MTAPAKGFASAELAELAELSARLNRVLSQLTEVLITAQLERDRLLDELARRTPTRCKAPPGPFTHVGQIVRWLRETAGLTRGQLEYETGVADSTIRNIETVRHRPTVSILRKLLRHPSMVSLPEMANQAGLSLRPRSPHRKSRVQRDARTPRYSAHRSYK